MNTNHKIFASRPLEKTCLSPIHRAFSDQSGQTLPFVALLMIALLGVSGLVVDVGHAYVVRSQIQNSANAAALAAAGYVYTSDTASVNTTTQADEFGATGPDNPSSYVTAAPVVEKVCLNILMPSGTSCTASSTPNAVRVTQIATVKTFFMGMFGVPNINVSAAATASMIGGEAQPWNVAIVLDATGSMNYADPNCGSGYTQFTCATTAIQAMLGAASPCKPGFSTCATSNANLHISLFTFPGVTTASVSADTLANCSATPSFMLYTLPLTTNTSYSPLSYTESSGGGYGGGGGGSTTWTATYQIVPFSSDYYSPTASNHLNTSSVLVSAVAGCMTPIQQPNNATGGMQGSPSTTNGGVTYEAPSIYAAQAALLAEQAANPGTQNAIILLSDGQSNMGADSDDFPSEQNATLASGSSGYASPTGTGLYPDVTDECQQSIMAAQAAAAAGTRVYAVSYGAETYGCSYTVGSNPSKGIGSYGTDNTTVATGTNASFTAATITPCITMENVASNLKYFYSDYNQSDAGTGPDRNCIDSSHPVTTLSDILLSVVSDFLRPRLLPSNATFVVTSTQ
jgi:Flp pilus assembly protein TadG